MLRQTDAGFGELSGFWELFSQAEMKKQENTHYVCSFPCLRARGKLLRQTQMGWDGGTRMGLGAAPAPLSPAPSWTFHIQIHIWMLWQGPSSQEANHHGSWLS